MIAVYRELYLRTPTAEDTARIMAHNKVIGFFEMLGSMDWMHWA
jgi:hypothetical protein